MIYWQITVGIVVLVQTFKNMFGINGRVLVVAFATLGLGLRWLRFGQIDPWAALFTVALAVLVYDFVVFPILTAFWHKKA